MSANPGEVLLQGARLLLDEGAREGWLLVRDGRVAALGRAGEPPPSGPERVALPGGHLAPGLIDLHVHGGSGIDLMSADDTGFDLVERGLASRGVTGYLATTYSAAPVPTLRAVHAIAAHRSTVGAELLGAHLEGPWLAPARAGAHPRDRVREIDPGELAALLATGAVRVVVHAPELPGADRLRHAVRAAGAIVAIGHTEADTGTMRAAIDDGARVVTHLFNAMPGLDHRDPGPVGVALTDDRVTVELIADGAHLHPAVLALAWRAAGAARTALVSDVGPGVDARGRRDGAPVMLPDGSALERLPALDDGVRTLASAIGEPFAETWRRTAIAPARLLGLDDRGAIAVGRRADLVWIDDADRVAATWVAGVLRYGGRDHGAA